jgi:hypothetical protein
MKKINYLYHVSQTINGGYDTYDSFIIACKTPREAQYTHPNDNITWNKEKGAWYFQYKGSINPPCEVDPGGWCLPNAVMVKCIGVAGRGVKGILISSFNAG